MQLTSKQEAGLKIAVARYKAGEKYTVISGFAGTGKSTLVKFIVEALNIPPEDIRYVAYTGKAANVLKNKGCQNAITAHKLLYHAKLMSNGKYLFSPRDILEGQPTIVIVDEVSMLPKDLWDLLCSHNVYIIALGDPMQLPPIEKDQNNGILEHPHIFLDEVMRQAQESEIIRLSMHVREGKPLYTFPKTDINQEVMIVRPFEVTDGMMLWADQIICATNNTRKNLNFHMRKILEYPTDHPVIGDKMINLHNEWEILSSNNNPLTNGVIGQIKKYETINYAYPYALRRKPTYVNLLKMDITGDEAGETFSNLTADYNELLTGIPSFTGKEEYLLQRRYKKEPFPLHFNYGYAITCWKAQGSEWGKILGYEENFPYTSDEHTKYLYTLITRAQNKLVLVRA